MTAAGVRNPNPSIAHLRSMECRCSGCSSRDPLAMAASDPSTLSLATELRLYALSFVVAGISGALTCLFALAGAFAGALTGALAGRISNSSVLRGAIFGAFAGSIISIEVLEAARSYWCSEQLGSQNALSMVEFIADLLNARLVQGQLPSGLTMNRWQIDSAVLTSDEFDDVVEPIPAKGLSLETLQKLPSHVATETRNICGERACCTICFQDIEVGEILRSLPLCTHRFHLACVDRWLLVRGSCPICRRKV